jgi:membrane-associated protein
LDKIIWAMIFIPGALAIYGSWKASRASQTNAEPPAVQ